MYEDKIKKIFSKGHQDGIWDVVLGSKITSHIFDTNINKSTFYEFIKLFNDYTNIKYNKYKCYKHLNTIYKISKNNSYYYLETNNQWFDIIRSTDINNLDIIGINYISYPLPKHNFKLLTEYHSENWVEEIILTLYNNINLCFEITNNTNYKIYIQIDSKNDINKLTINKISQILETLILN